MNRKSKISNYYKLLEFITILYFCLGGMKRISIFRYIDYTLALLIIVLMIGLILKKQVLRKKIILMLSCNFVIIFLSALYMFYIGVEIQKIVNRIVPLVSIFGIISLYLVKGYTPNINKIIKKTIYAYYILGILIIGDALIFKLAGRSFWQPVEYLGNRFSGPFYDSNYLGLFYGVMLIIHLYNKNLYSTKRITMIYIVVLFMSGSWTSIGLLIISIMIGKFLKFKSIFNKQITYLSAYLILTKIVVNYLDSIKSIFISIMSKILNMEMFLLEIKFTSLEYRIVTQMNALDIVRDNLGGMGPLSIVPLLGRDVHNSYVSFMFELGIMGFSLLIINFMYSTKSYNKCLDLLSSYIIFMAFTLDVHYTIVYPMLLILIIKKYLEDREYKIIN